MQRLSRHSRVPRGRLAHEVCWHVDVSAMYQDGTIAGFFLGDELVKG